MFISSIIFKTKKILREHNKHTKQSKEQNIHIDIYIYIHNLSLSLSLSLFLSLSLRANGFYILINKQGDILSLVNYTYLFIPPK